MADPLSILGAISASVSLAEKVGSYLSRLRDAPEQARALLSEVIETGELLRMLRSRLETDHGHGNDALLETSILFFAVNGCRGKLEEIDRILSPLASGSSRARLMWPFRRSDANEVVESLHRYVQIFHFAVHLDGL